MPIRTDDEYRSAQARLDEEQAILRSRTFTDDEQHQFDALVWDIAAYRGTPAPAAGGAPPVPQTPRSPVDAAPHRANPEPASTLANGIAASGASMERELRRQGLVGADHRQQHGSASMQASASSMQRELRRAGLARG
ncbi:hypothetical protein [Methylobacterium segetis]|uniref:hypothetical protein n=1 Tax=Methylobacterium segetis TaxID=2488750 RepID=UPI00105189E5|nr:hypothetical protein [Methylobacterium segetis]